jgi:hypothetical protein
VACDLYRAGSDCGSSSRGVVSMSGLGRWGQLGNQILQCCPPVSPSNKSLMCQRQVHVLASLLQVSGSLNFKTTPQTRYNVLQSARAGVSDASKLERGQGVVRIG